MKKLLLLCFILLIGCESISVRPDGGPKIISPPTYEESKEYYFFGVVGEHHIDLHAICKDDQIKQFQSQTTFVDGLLGAITLGIYSPRSARVWCAPSATKGETL